MLLGPLRALDYFFSHGLLAVVLGAIWHLKSHWSVSLVVGAVTRLVGLLGYFYITAWMLKEDLFSLLLNNVYSLLVDYTSHMHRWHACNQIFMIHVIGPWPAVLLSADPAKKSVECHCWACCCSFIQPICMCMPSQHPVLAKCVQPQASVLCAASSQTPEQWFSYPCVHESTCLQHVIALTTMIG